MGAKAEAALIMTAAAATLIILSDRTMLGVKLNLDRVGQRRKRILAAVSYRGVDNVRNDGLK